MRKLLCLLFSLLLCTSLMLPAMAAETVFIPSAGLEITKAAMDGEDVLKCVTVTSVTEAKEKSTDISQEERDLLMELYDALSQGKMVLPLEGEYQYVEMLDLSFALASCRELEDHNHKADTLKNTDAALTVDFKLEIKNHDGLIVLTYIDEKWEIVDAVEIHDDDIVTVTFQDICPVLFLAPEGEGEGEAEYPANMTYFVPSITYKGGPAVEEATLNGEGVLDCVVVTTIEQAEEKTTDISQEERDLLLEIYEKLEEGTMELPLEKHHVIRELIDVSFKHDACRQDEEHGHKDEILAQEEVTLTVVFDLDVSKDAEVIVMAYVDEEWVAIESVENNGDGTVKCVFEEICPVAIAVEDAALSANPGTGDAAGSQLLPVIAVMCLSAVGIVALVVTKARKSN